MDGGAASVGGGDFDDDDVVACYRHRAPYPAALFDRLAELAPDRDRALDLGCGPGKLAHGLASHFAAVDAVDPSAHMLVAGRGADTSGGRIAWIQGGGETAPLAASYDLIVAGASIHWMAHAVVMPRLAAVLAPGAPLALVEGDGPAEAPWLADLQAVIVRWVERGGRTWNDRTHQDLVAAHEPWFDRLGAETLRHTVRQPFEDFITAQHARATWARARMGADAEVFDADLRAVLQPAADAEGVLTFDVDVRLVWGHPRSTPRPPEPGA